MITKTTSKLWVISNGTAEVVRVAANEKANLIGVRFDKTLLKNLANGIDVTPAAAREFASALTEAADLSAAQTPAPVATPTT